MTINLKLIPELEQRLLAEAQAQGVSVEKVAERLLSDALAQRPESQGNLSQEEFALLLKELSKNSGSLPPLATDSFTRESFYQERS